MTRSKASSERHRHGGWRPPGATGEEGALRSERWFRLREWFTSSNYLIPALIVLASVGLAFALVALDEATERDLTASYSSATAVAMLSAIAGGMITFTGFVVSGAFTLAQFGAGQYSPRIMRPWLRYSLTPKVALGVFVATFTYALIVLGRVSPEDDPDFVPNLSVTVAVLLVLLSAFSLIRIFYQALSGVVPAQVMEQLARRTRREIDRRFPNAAGAEQHAEAAPEIPERSTELVRHDGRPAVLVHLDADELVATAQRNDLVVELAPAVGDFVPTGAPLFVVHGEGIHDPSALASSVSFGRQRDFAQDVAWGLRLLADIAERALSAAVNDPTTAVEVLDQLEDLLARLGTRSLATGAIADAEGTIRLVVRTPTWEEYVDLALTEVRQYGVTSAQVARRLRALIDRVSSVVPAERRPALRAHRDALDQAVERSFTGLDRTIASGRDRQGLGSSWEEGSGSP